MRNTSAEAYAKIEDSGLLTGLRWSVYAHLFHHGPLTAHEVASALAGYQIDSIRPRFAELETLRVIEVVGERECSITEMKALVWDVTAYVPSKTGVLVQARKFWIVVRANGAKLVFETAEEAAAENCATKEVIAVKEVGKRRLLKAKPPEQVTTNSVPQVSQEPVKPPTRIPVYVDRFRRR